MHVEVHTHGALADHLASGLPLKGLIIQNLDLRGFSLARSATPPSDLSDLGRLDLAGVTFLGCVLAPDTLVHAITCGALVFPPLPALPFSCFRPALYTIDELMAGYDAATPRSFFTHTRDANIYDFYVTHHGAANTSPLDALAQRLHDHAIDDALADFLGRGESRKKVVAIMGGHGLGRDTPAYREVAHLAADLTRDGFTLASGGGPGAMEATHLGAWFADRPDLIDTAIATLAAAPTYKDPRWFDTAYAARALTPCAAESLAIPTWFYGHEPTNLFATHIAKYFSNSLREDGLLMIATHGVVYARGMAGTVQEIFMDACQNHYGTAKFLSPMVFLDAAYWTEVLPAVPLIRALAKGRPYADLIHVTDARHDARRFLLEHPPRPA
jgi:predicted Rossmann-fold nucleotide-binding protein